MPGRQLRRRLGGLWHRGDAAAGQLQPDVHNDGRLCSVARGVLEEDWNQFAQNAFKNDPGFSEVVASALTAPLSLIPAPDPVAARVVTEAANQLAGRLPEWRTDSYFRSFALGANLDFLAADVMTATGRSCAGSGQL